MSGIVGSRFNIRGSGLVGSLGTDGQVFTSSGAGTGAAFEDAAGGGYTTGSVTAMTSGSSISLTGIPSDATQVHVIFDQVSLSGDDTMIFQIGDSGGIETSGYHGSRSRLSGTSLTGGTSTAHLEIQATYPPYSISGFVTLHLCDVSNNAWVMHCPSVVLNQDDSSVQMDQRAVCYKSLSGTLTQVQFDTDGTNTFDGGECIIRYIT